MKAVDFQSQFGDGLRQSWPWKVSSIGVVAVPKLDHRIMALEERLQRLQQQHRQSDARPRAAGHDRAARLLQGRGQSRRLCTQGLVLQGVVRIERQRSRRDAKAY